MEVFWLLPLLTSSTPHWQILCILISKWVSNKPVPFHPGPNYSSHWFSFGRWQLSTKARMTFLNLNSICPCHQPSSTFTTLRTQFKFLSQPTQTSRISLTLESTLEAPNTLTFVSSSPLTHIPTPRIHLNPSLKLECFSSWYLHNQLLHATDSVNQPSSERPLLTCHTHFQNTTAFSIALDCFYSLSPSTGMSSVPWPRWLHMSKFIKFCTDLSTPHYTLIITIQSNSIY